MLLSSNGRGAGIYLTIKMNSLVSVCQTDTSLQNRKKKGQINVDLADSGVVHKEHLNMPVIAEVVMREQPEHLRDYFLERLKFYREASITLPKPSDPRYVEMADQNAKK